MAARFESDVGRGPCHRLLSRAQRHDFSVRLSRALVIALANDAIALGDDTSNPRVGMSCFQSSLSEGQCPRHGEAIKFSEHQVTRKRSSLTGRLSRSRTT